MQLRAALQRQWLVRAAKGVTRTRAHAVAIAYREGLWNRDKAEKRGDQAM